MTATIDNGYEIIKEHVIKNIKGEGELIFTHELVKDSKLSTESTLRALNQMSREGLVHKEYVFYDQSDDRIHFTLEEAMKIFKENAFYHPETGERVLKKKLGRWVPVSPREALVPWYTSTQKLVDLIPVPSFKIHKEAKEWASKIVDKWDGEDTDDLKNIISLAMSLYKEGKK